MIKRELVNGHGTLMLHILVDMTTCDNSCQKKSKDLGVE